VAGLARAFGSGAMTNSIGEIPGADTILALGSNATEAHPVIGYRVREAVRKGAKLIVADPRETWFARAAMIHLRLKAGTDIALLNGMMNVIISEGLANEDFIATRTEGFADLSKTVARYTPEYAAEITGVPAELIREAARVYATSERASILYTLGITQHICGTENVMAVANLALATGNIGKPSTGVNPLRGQNNVQGACDMGALPDVYTSYQKVEDPAAREKFEKAWGVELNPEPGLTSPEFIDEACQGKVKAMFIMGENSIVTDADTNHLIKALENLELLVVQDIFLTDTAEYADVVLPAACFAEKEGTFTNTERRVQIFEKAVTPPGEALPDWQIVTMLARKLGLPWDYSSAEEVFAEMASLSPLYAGISYERLRKEGLQWPCPDADHPGTPYLHVDRFSRGLGLFHALEYRPPAELPDEEYPFLLNTGRHLFHYGTMTRFSRGLDLSRPEELLQVNSADAARLGIKEKDMVKLTSRRGEVDVKATITDIVPPGTLFMTLHYRESMVNLLTISAFDSITRTPEMKVCAVKLTRN